VRNSPIVLQDVVVLGSGCYYELLDHGQNLHQLIVRDIREFRAVGFRDDERVARTQRAYVEEGNELGRGIERERRNVSFDNFAEDTSCCHG